jgi:hypothetical protein
MSKTKSLAILLVAGFSPALAQCIQEIVLTRRAITRFTSIFR